jgi:hypothetical protein
MGVVSTDGGWMRMSRRGRRTAIAPIVPDATPTTRRRRPAPSPHSFLNCPQFPASQEHACVSCILPRLVIRSHGGVMRRTFLQAWAPVDRERCMVRPRLVSPGDQALLAIWHAGSWQSASVELEFSVRHPEHCRHVTASQHRVRLGMAIPPQISRRHRTCGLWIFQTILRRSRVRKGRAGNRRGSQWERSCSLQVVRQDCGSSAERDIFRWGPRGCRRGARRIRSRHVPSNMPVSGCSAGSPNTRAMNAGVCE